MMTDNRKEQKKTCHGKQKSRKLVTESIWEDEQSHHPQFLPSRDCQAQLSFAFDTTRFNFRELIISIFECCCPAFEASRVASKDQNEVDILEMIHTITETPVCPNRTIYHTAMNTIKNAKTPCALALYAQYKALLLDFVREVAAPLLNEDATTRPAISCATNLFLSLSMYNRMHACQEPDNLIFQRHPTLRVCLPSDQPMGVPHTDYEYHHMPAEVNIWLPLTRVYGANTLYTESRPGAADYNPVELSYGEGLRFWGNKCRHYTVPNTTSTTRVSLDFRVIARSRFNPNFVDMKHRVGGLFHVGQYYVRSSNTTSAEDTDNYDETDTDTSAATNITRVDDD